MYPDNLKYTLRHVWVEIDGNIAVIGITHHAKEQLGELTYIELPQEGDAIAAGNTLGQAESVKSISDIYAPVSGKVVEVNEAVLDEPAVVNADPYGDGWMIKVEMTNLAEADELLNAEQYQATL
jgi:glycine cleavage system H protein